MAVCLIWAFIRNTCDSLIAVRYSCDKVKTFSDLLAIRDAILDEGYCNIVSSYLLLLATTCTSKIVHAADKITSLGTT